MVAIKRVYEPANSADGVRVLVDRVWPRGRTKNSLHIAQWMKDLAPSAELRRFFGHDPDRWQEFRKRYLKELERPEIAPLLDQLIEFARNAGLTMIYGAKDTERNQAAVLKEFIETHMHKA